MSSTIQTSRHPEESLKKPPKGDQIYHPLNGSSHVKATEYQDAQLTYHNESLSTEDTERKQDLYHQPIFSPVHEFHSHSNQLVDFRFEARDVEVKIKNEFRWQLPLLCLDLLLTLYGWGFAIKHSYPEQDMFPFFISGIMAGIYSIRRLDTTAQLYTCVVYILMLLWNLQSVYTVLVMVYKSYNQEDYSLDTELAYFHSAFAASLLLHIIIAFEAFDLVKLMKERASLLATINMKTTLPSNTEWQQLNDIESQGQLPNRQEIISRFRRTIDSEFSLDSTLAYFGVLLLLFWGFTSEGSSFGTYKLILIFLSALATGLAAKFTYRPFRQICCFAVIFSMTLICFYPICAHIVKLFFCVDCSTELFIMDVFLIASIIWSPSVLRNAWRVAELLQERECVVNHFESFHNVAY